MELVNPTPLVLQAVPLQIRRNGFILVLIVKGTFAVRGDGRLRLADEQLPVLFGDEYNDPEQGGSVRFESDLVPFKPRADIILAGQAYAPQGRPTTHLEVGLQVGNCRRSVVVFGDRYWDADSGHTRMTPTKPFTTMPLVYERAFGGMDELNGAAFEANPVGRGFLVKRPPNEHPFPLPNLENPDHLIRTWQDRPPPAGFGVVGKTWQPRAGHLGTYDEQWQEELAPGPPKDFRSDFFNAAPVDLQVQGYLQGDETVKLINLTPDGMLGFRLPGRRIQARVTLTQRDDEGYPLDAGTRIEEPAMRLDTLGLLPDQRRFFMVWRSHCRIDDLTAREVDRVEIGLP